MTRKKDGNEFTPRVPLAPSVKRTKAWWRALSSDERNHIVRVEASPKDYRSRNALCQSCWLHPSEFHERCVCASCAERYNRLITRANDSLNPSPMVI